MTTTNNSTKNEDGESAERREREERLFLDLPHPSELFLGLFHLERIELDKKDTRIVLTYPRWTRLGKEYRQTILEWTRYKRQTPQQFFESCISSVIRNNSLELCIQLHGRIMDGNIDDETELAMLQNAT